MNITREEVLKIIKDFSGQNNVITIPKIFIKLLGSISSAIFLNQLLYWQDKMKGEWLFKTYETWNDETGLSEYEVRKSSKLFYKLGFLETRIKKANGNPTVHYKLNKDNFLDWFLKILSIENENFKFPIIKTINKESLSKDKDEGKSKISQSFKNDSLIEYWNSLQEKYPMIRQHKKPETKIYQNTSKMLTHLKKGTFENFVSLDHTFLKRNHIPLTLVNDKWPEARIKKCIDRLPKLFIKGIWPDDKSKLPKDLNTLIFNPRTNKSWLLYVAINNPHPKHKGKTNEQIDNEIKYKTKGKITEEELQTYVNKTWEI